MKKKSIERVIAFCVLTLFIAGIYQSCTKQNIRQIDTKAVSQSDAIEIFKKAKKELDLKFEQYYGNISPAWDKSLVKQLTQQNFAIYTPLAFNKETGSYLQLICFKDKGKLRSLITEMKPDKDFYEQSGFENFYAKLNGKLLFYTVTGTFVKGFKMRGGLSQGKYYPETELSSIAVLNRSTGTNSLTTDPDPCEGNWGNFGCQELTSVVVEATPSSGGGVVYISIPLDLYYSSPMGGTYGGYAWTPISAPVTPDYVNLGADGVGDPCPSSFRFKNLTSTMRRASVWGLYYEVYDYPSNQLVQTLTFGLEIDIPSDMIYSPNWTRDNLMAKFGSKLSSADLVIYTDAQNIEHLRISQAAQTLIAAEAVKETNLYVKASGLIPEIVMVGSSYFKQQYKEKLLTELYDLLAGCRVQTLNSNVDGTTPYRSESIFGC